MPVFSDLKVYQLAYKLAMEIFELSRNFPKDEKYSLTDQIRIASRAVCSNIAEAYRKRIYPKHFSSKITDADAEASETTSWINFTKDCGYISSEIHTSLQKRYDEVGKMLGSMANNPEKFLPENTERVSDFDNIEYNTGKAEYF